MNLPLVLDQLENAQLLRPLVAEEPAYIFRHALTQDAAYDSLLKKTRRDIHLQVARTMESLYADQLDANAALLARHYAEAGDDLKTVEYAARAGDASARVYANAEAVAHYSMAIDAARRGLATTSMSGLRELYIKRGREQELASQFPAALANYAEMESLARGRGARALELSALVAQCQIRCTPNPEFNPSLGEPLAEKTLQLARELKDRAAESKILWILVNLYRFTDRLPQARQAGERSLQIARELNLREQMAYTLNDLPHVYAIGGDFKHARLLVEEAMQLWRELKNLPMLADSLATASMENNVVGRFDESIAFSEEAYQISQAIGNLWGQTYSLSNLGLAYWARGETARAIETMGETLRLSEQSGYRVPKLITRADLGVVLASMGAFERAIELARQAIEFAQAHYQGMRPYALGALVQIYLWMGDHARAAAVLGLFAGSRSDGIFFSIYESISTVRLTSAQSDHAHALEACTRLLQQLIEFSMRTFMPEALCCKGLAEFALGRADSARTSLLQARAEAQAIGHRWQMWQILGALGQVEAASGNQSQAKHLFEEARESIAYIADHTPWDLRDSFLNLPHVRKVGDLHVEI